VSSTGSKHLYRLQTSRVDHGMDRGSQEGLARTHGVAVTGDSAARNVSNLNASSLKMNSMGSFAQVRARTQLS
jgi:hypothetical protein